MAPIVACWRSCGPARPLATARPELRLSRQAYELDLRQYASWCSQHYLQLFGARRADIECFARELEARGRARATITRRLCTIAGFYRYAVEEERLDHSPAVHVRRPRPAYGSHATALDRNELGALLVAAGRAPRWRSPPQISSTGSGT
jgi:integrase/recombinase XerD